MTPYLPGLSSLAALATTWIIGAVLLLAGAGLVAAAPEIQIMAGWGAFSLLLTTWGVFLPLTLAIPALGFSLAALLVLLLPHRRPDKAAWVALGRMLAVSLPLWLILAPIRPSQPDTFMNLLPNAAYLVEYGRFPTAALPPSFSYLPGAPYNSQFLSYLGSFLKRDYPASGMSLVNLMLQLAAALAIARALSRSPEDSPSWPLAATGFLLVTLLNPGFVPRIDFASYGEPALASAALVAALLFVRGLGELARGRRTASITPLALTLAAIVNTKQSGPGLVIALAGAALATAAAERALDRRAALRLVAASLVPATILYGTWRYQMAHAGVAELAPLPVGQWNWADLPRIFESALDAAFGKATYFIAVLLALAGFGLLLRRQGWTPTSRLLGFFAALFILYNGFLFAAYIALFPGEMSEAAHSFYRYNTHLSLVLMLALALAARDLGLVRRLGDQPMRAAGGAMLALALVAPVGFIKFLRFDLEMPQPLVWRLAKNVAPHLKGHQRLAALLPGDNGSVATMLAGVLRYTAPQSPRLSLLVRTNPDRATLDEFARRGYRLALISCVPQGLDGLPAGEAALIRREPGGWRLVAAWPYPAGARQQSWQYILSWRPLCRNAGPSSSGGATLDDLEKVELGRTK